MLSKNDKKFIRHSVLITGAFNFILIIYFLKDEMNTHPIAVLGIIAYSIVCLWLMYHSALYIVSAIKRKK